MALGAPGLAGYPSGMSDEQLSRIRGTQGARRHFRTFDYVMSAFV
jgi:hypothetical protein